MIKWMNSLLILFIIISCRGNNKILNQEVVTFFSWQPSRFLFLLDSIGVVQPYIIPDSVYFISKSISKKEGLKFPKDSIKILSNNIINNNIRTIAENSNRYNYMIMEIPEYDIGELLNKPKDSLAILLKIYVKNNFKLVIYKDGISCEKELNDTSKIILKPVYWGVD